jgi:hypothetical protein
VLKQGVQQRAGGGRLGRDVVCPFYLPRDLALPDHQAVETRGDAEQVTDRCAVPLLLQMRAN